MISRRSTASSTSSQCSASGEGVKQILRKTYKDPARLRQGLDQLLGEGQYTLKLRNNRYIIHGPRPLDADELAGLEEFSFQHYDSF